MPDVVKRWMREPDPAETYDWRRVEILFDALTKLPPRDFARFRDIALGDGREHEWNAALGMALTYIFDQFETHPVDSAQYADAVARADELQRLTMGD
jgi:hypothetical protein